MRLGHSFDRQEPPKCGKAEISTVAVNYTRDRFAADRRPAERVHVSSVRGRRLLLGHQALEGGAHHGGCDATLGVSRLARCRFPPPICERHADGCQDLPDPHQPTQPLCCGGCVGSVSSTVVIRSARRPVRPGPDGPSPARLPCGCLGIAGHMDDRTGGPGPPARAVRRNTSVVQASDLCSPVCRGDHAWLQDRYHIRCSPEAGPAPGC